MRMEAKVRSRKMRRRRLRPLWTSIGVLAILTVFVWWFHRPYLMWWNEAQNVHQLELDRAAIERDNQQLRDQVRLMSTESGKASEARALGMVFPGEERLVLPDATPAPVAKP